MKKQCLISLIAIMVLVFTASAFGGEVYYPTGTYNLTETDLKVAARGFPMTWERSYQSNNVIKKGDKWVFQQPVDGPLGYGWSTPWTTRIEIDSNVPNIAYYVAADGRYFFFQKDASNNYLPDKTNGLILTKTAAGYEVQEVGANTMIFNGAGKLTAIKDPRGRAANIIYDGSGNIASITDVMNRTVFTFTYAGNHISQITDLGQRTIDYQYDGFGNLAKVLHNGQVLFTYMYNVNHGMTSESNALNEAYKISYQYPDKGIVSRVTDPATHSMMFSYDFQNRILRATNYNGVTRKYVLNADGKIISESDIVNSQEKLRRKIDYVNSSRKTVDASGNTTTEQLDTWGNVLSRTEPEGNHIQTTYNAQNKPVKITDPLGVVTSFAYDSTGVYPTKITRAEGRPEQVVVTISYNGTGDLASTTTAGAASNFTYNAMGLPVTITDPMGNVSKLEYDEVGNVTAAIDANNNRTEFAYDFRGNLRTAKDPLGNITTYSYNQAGRLASVTNALGHATTTQTDFAGRVKSVTNAVGSIKTFSYDGNGNLITITQGNAITTMTYDNLDRLKTETDPEGNIARYEYDDSGCTTCGTSGNIPKKITDPLGNVTQNTIDKNGKVTSVQDPLGHLTNFVHDAAGRITSRTDANGNTTTYAYDGLGRPVSQTDANGGTTSFTYDARGNLTSFTDPNGNTTFFEYDLAGRKTAEIRPMGQTIDYTHYPNGLIKTVNDPKNQTTTFTYDKVNQLTTITFDDGKQNTFGYDAAGNMTSYASESVSGTITYDAANRKIGEAVNFGTFTRSYSYSYDGRGNKKSYTSPEGQVYTYTFNKNNQPTQIVFGANTITYTYEWNRPKKTELPNGIITDYGYNNNSWMNSIISKTTSTTISTSQYTFDMVGNIIGKMTEKGTHIYGYDPTYQLTSAEVPNLPNEAYTYDKTGNRTTSNSTQGVWNYTKNNELTGYDQTTLAYDENGNTVQQTKNGQSTTYIYNTRDRLETVNLPDGRTATYAYDPFGRRIKKQVGTDTTYFMYAEEGLISEYDSSGTVKKSYGWMLDGIWATDPVFMLQNDQYYFYHNDHLGTTQRITDIHGNTVWDAIYAAFGVALIETDAAFINNLRFPGQYFDEETGMTYNWYRYYDRVTGRYIQVDPIFSDGGINYYTYAFNNPLQFIDQYGLKGTGHHIIPWGLFSGGQVSQEVHNFWDSDSARIFDEAYKGHNAGKINGISHYDYSQSVREELDKFMKAKRTCKKKLTLQQAKEFLDYLLRLPKNSRISMFLEGVKTDRDAAIAAALKNAKGKVKVGGTALGVLGTVIDIIGFVDAEQRAKEHGVDVWTQMIADHYEAAGYTVIYPNQVY
jgi:large repetitive protein